MLLILIRVKTNFLLTQVKVVEGGKSFGVKSPLESTRTRRKMSHERLKKYEVKRFDFGKVCFSERKKLLVSNYYKTA